jgi:DNA-binding NarL/FixJ family response regulator
MKLVIADDHPLIVDGLEALVDGTEFEVHGRYSNGQDLLNSLDGFQADIFVLDINMQPVSGLEVLQQLRSQGHPARIVILTGSMDDECLVEAVRLGVDAILLKKAASRQLLDCLRKVGKGERWLDPDVTERLVKAAVGSGNGETGGLRLTSRELEIARLVAAGLRNKQIAHETGMAEPTVKMHLHNIFQKLGIGSRTELALLANSRGLL